MKRVLLTILSATAVVGCSKESGDKVDTAVKFEATNIVTRLNSQSTEWIKGDGVGISTTGFSGAEYSNICYEAASSAAATEFTLVSGQSEILFPDVSETEGATVSFYAYYPYDAAAGNGAVTVDLSAQKDNLASVDLLTASKSGVVYYSGMENSEKKVSFTFNHKLSQVILNITCNNNLTSLETLAVTLKQVATKGDYLTAATDSAAEGTLSGELTEVVDVPLTVTLAENNQSATVVAILHPGTYDATSTLSFVVGEKSYSKPFEAVLEAGTSQSYNLSIGNDIVGFDSGSTIGAWITSGTNTTLYPERD